MRLMDVMPEGIGQGLAARIAMEILKDAVAFAGISGQGNQAYLLARMDPLACLLNVLHQLISPCLKTIPAR